MMHKVALTLTSILLLIFGCYGFASARPSPEILAVPREEIPQPLFIQTPHLVSMLSELELEKTLTQKQKGISYASWWPGQYSHPDADLALAKLADTGANWVSLIVTQYQDNINSTDINATTATPTDADLIHVILQAHDLGLMVMLKPHVDLANDPTHWRGQIGEEFSETEWATWFSSYQMFINHYAQLAQTHGVDQFSVGTELTATQSREANWRAVISELRNIYSGPLTYAANHGSENDVTWWDAVDYIGVDAYYPLTDKNDPTVAELIAAWQPRISSLENLASVWNKSIIFTEIGYRSQDGTNQRPWDTQGGGTVDLQEQADSYRAAFESLSHQPWFAGMHWWAWRTDPFQGGPCDDGRTPYDKPAEDVLRYWYGANPRVSKPGPQPDYSQTMEIFTDNLASGWVNRSWSASIDFSSTDPVFSGTKAISVTAQDFGALSLGHPSFYTHPYYFLEFYILKSSSDQELRVFAHDDTDAALRYRPIDDCRYTNGQPIEPGVWTRVRIPLSHLDASGRLIQRVSIMNNSTQPIAYSVDEMRFVGATWRVFLPRVFQINP
jgi:hypothetical protein